MTIRTNGVAYWACQGLGWGAYSAIGLWAAVQQTGWRPALAIGYLLYSLYSIALTDLLLRDRLRQHRAGGLAGGAWARLLGAAAGVGAIQTFLIVAIDVALQGGGSVFNSPRQVLFAGLGTTAATMMWVVYYLRLTATRRRREQEAQLHLALREAELRALEAQISPHFFFNCLNSIRGLVIEDPARAQDMITRLASLLRHNLRHDLRHTVSFSSELDAVTDYLALESVRFEDRLRVRFDIAQDALPVQVPSMLLQTLVENAVKHGIAMRPEGGDLLIRATVGQQQLVLEVENTGRLTDARPGATQVGLANARDRLRILYGGRAGLDLTAHANRVAAKVLIPVEV